VAAGLERAYGSPVSFHNFAVAGWTADHGAGDVDRIVDAKPDLVIIAYGMNDAGYADASCFGLNIGAIIEEVRRGARAAEFVLVSPMLPNPDWDYVALDRFPAYRTALSNLCGPGTVLADVTSLWSDVLLRKRFEDLTGNGLNHPNDFGHRLYAQVILTVLVDPDVSARAQRTDEPLAR
jgi:lysophospholipase L1-like esterase